MMVTLGNSASLHSALFMYIDASLRPETMKVSFRSGRSKIAATAIDHIGANPVPLATMTMPPGWLGRRKAIPSGPLILTR